MVIKFLNHCIKKELNPSLVNNFLIYSAIGEIKLEKIDLHLLYQMKPK